MSDLTTNPNWNKLRLNVMNVVREPSIIQLFLKNQWFALLDVGLHAQGGNSVVDKILALVLA